MTTQVSKGKIFFRSIIVVFWVFIFFMGILMPKFIPTSKRETNSINVFSWSDVIPPEVAEQFERDTGIKVYVDYYSSNEELLTKVKATNGSGYDLIVPSDYAVQILANNNSLKPLNKSKIDFIEKLNPQLLKHDFDPENHYSLPIQWEAYGFGIDKEVFKAKKQFTWDDLFRLGKKDYKIAMSSDPIEAVCLASFYLFGSKAALDIEELSQIKSLLKTQKKNIEAYAVPRSDYLLATKNTPLVFTTTGYIQRTKVDFPFINFTLPEKGTFVSIENVAIPKDTQKDEMVYKFLNYLFQDNVRAVCCNQYQVFPSTNGPEQQLDYKEFHDQIKSRLDQEGYEIYFFRHLISEKDLRNLWVDIKSS